MVTIDLNGSEHATVLAALRYYQEHGLGDPSLRSNAIHDIATNHLQEISLDASGIDILCERINTSSVHESLCSWEEQLIGKKVRRSDGIEFVVTEISEYIGDGEIYYQCNGERWFANCDEVEVIA